MPKVLDSHSHYMPPGVAENTAFYKVNWSDLDKQLSLMDENGIERALLLYPTSDAHLNMGGWSNVCDVYNQEIADVVKKYPDRFIGGGILPADAPDKFPDELSRIHGLGLRVISLASSYEGMFLDDEVFNPVYEFAQKNNFPIHVHSQILNPIGEARVKDPLLTPVFEYMFDVSMCIGKLMMSGTFLKFPDVKFIFAHFGGILPLVKERFDTTYTMLRKREFVKDISKNPSEYFQNLYFDISGSKSIGSLKLALEVTDAEHILFGSDFPANQKITQTIGAISQSQLSDTDQSNILYNNISRLVA